MGPEGEELADGAMLTNRNARMYPTIRLPSKHELMEAETMPEGASPYNALHMAGNALEYVGRRYHAEPGCSPAFFADPETSAGH